jgi:hypothetical protein
LEAEPAGDPKVAVSVVVSVVDPALAAEQVAACSAVSRFRA